MEKILRNNQIIDKYMGNVWDINHPNYPKYSPRLKYWINERIENQPYYNESWDLIIPVSKKVLGDLILFVDRAKSVNFNEKYTKFIESIMHRYSRIKYSLEEFKLEDFYNQIVESIVFMSLYENFDDDSKRDEPIHFF